MSGEVTPLRTPRAPGADKKLARLMRGTFLVAVALGVAAIPEGLPLRSRSAYL